MRPSATTTLTTRGRSGRAMPAIYGRKDAIAVTPATRTLLRTARTLSAMLLITCPVPPGPTSWSPTGAIRSVVNHPTHIAMLVAVPGLRERARLPDRDSSPCVAEPLLPSATGARTGRRLGSNT